MGEHPVDAVDVLTTQHTHIAALFEEAVIKLALSELDALGGDDPSFDARLSSVRRVVLAHNAAEEADEFGPLRSAVPIDILREQVLFIRRAEIASPPVTATPEPLTPDPADVIIERVRDVLRPR